MKPKPNDSEDLLSRMVNEPEQTDGASATTGGAPVLPRFLEYTPLASNEKWRVEKFDLFAAEFELPWEGDHAGLMTLFHNAAMSYTRPWEFTRRLYGIGPAIPSPDANADELRVWSRAELCEQRGVTNEQLQAELNALRGIWKSAEEKNEHLTPALSPSGAEREKKGELAFGDEALREFGFSEKMFEMEFYNPTTKENEKRDSRENRIERDWFCHRVEEWRKMLAEPMATTVAREALMNELYLRRLQTEMAVLSPSSSKFKEMNSLKRNTAEEFQKQLTDLQDMFPEMSIAGKTSFRGNVSDLIKAVLEYRKDGSTVLVDKVRTAAEIEIEMRQSKQSPGVRYRYDLNVAIAEAIHGLYDPNFRSQFRPAVLKRLQAGFREGVERMRQTQDEPLVDLENGVMPGEGDQFPDLMEAEVTA